MARGDECKTATKANYACKNLDVATPMSKGLAPNQQQQASKKTEQKKDYGAWGPIYKDKKTFKDMHFC